MSKTISMSEAFIVLNKDTGEVPGWCEVKKNAGLAKRRYSNNRMKGHQYPDQTQDVCYQLVNPVLLNQLLDGCEGNGMSGDALIELIRKSMKS